MNRKWFDGEEQLLNIFLIEAYFDLRFSKGYLNSDNYKCIQIKEK